MKIYRFFCFIVSLFLLHNISFAQTEIKSVMYFDASSSMKGYLSSTSDARFKSILADISYGLDTDVCLCGVKVGRKISRSDFESLLKKKSIPWNDESDLTEMINSILNSISQTDIDCGLLVSDCIMSGSNVEIAHDRYYNKTYRGVMTAKVQKVFNDFNSFSLNKVSAIILQYQSLFNGEYFDYQNHKVRLNEQARPFYVIMFMKSELRDLYLSHIRESQTLSEYNHIYIIGDDAPELKILPYNQTGSYNGEVIRLNYKQIHKTGGLLNLSVNLSSLPEYFREKKYIDDYLNLVQVYGNDKIILDKSCYNTELIGSRLVISIEPNYVKDSSIQVCIENALPSWIIDSSSEDDSIINTDEDELHRTFNFRYLLDGFKPLNLYSQASSNLVKINK